MLRLVPRLTGEAPAGYVAFVASHLSPLRRDAAGVVGDGYDADRLYPDVLTDVAARWHWLELARTRLGRPSAAETYLTRAFDRRSRRWHADQLADESPDEVEIRVFDGADVVDLPLPPVSVSNAVRIAEVERPPVVREAAVAVMEAAIAWWHAYEAVRRRRILAVLVVLMTLVAMVIQLSTVLG